MVDARETACDRISPRSSVFSNAQAPPNKGMFRGRILVQGKGLVEDLCAVPTNECVLADTGLLIVPESLPIRRSMRERLTRAWRGKDRPPRFDTP